MNEAIHLIERELVRAARRRTAKRRARRRRAIVAVALALVALAGVSAAAAVNGEGPLADLLGVRRDDPELRFAAPKRGGERAVVVADSESGQRWRFAIFESNQALRLPGRPPAEDVFCATPVLERAERLDGLACGPPEGFLDEIRRDGLYFAPHGSRSHGETSGVLVISPVWGLVPHDARRVLIRTEDGSAREASMSKPFALGTEGKRRKPDTRAFLAVVDLPGDLRLRGFTPIEAAVELADGRVKRKTYEVAVGFPLVRTSKPEPGATRHEMGVAIGGRRWNTIAYEGARGSLCTSAAPAGEALIKLTRLQCSSPLAIIDAFERHGLAAYPSDTDPPGGGKRPGSYVVRGFTGADARAITLFDQMGRRWPAQLSPVWTTISRGPGDTAGLKGRFRERFAGLPKSAPVRTFVIGVATPPGPSHGEGVRLEVRLADGTTLTQP
jgi:hypothetical protein